MMANWVLASAHARRGHFPFVGGLAQDQEEQFDRSFVVWEVAAGAHGATKLGAACCGMRTRWQ
jgi:hypothetical protein